ncbi:transmembrane protein 62-like isoform X2 [Frieseomelitta varia]|uniref:transmembrane protein 62-like isoform X2 n=1 Tax=Frieseomelitta varia TaxID=561572 RepID=UPI001CB69584|nr:transmembrane protein 62-like isoform X2 [Frieseomelitta varia]
MKITKSTVILLVFVLMLSIFVANVADLINVDNHVLDDTLHNKDTKKEWSEPKFYDIGESFDHLMWFLQISDIHISIFQDSFRITELKEFCNITINSIKPSVVLASGDLTDAKAKDKMGSKQILEEWQYYKRVLDETEVTKKTLWLDVRGNHDNFNVLSLESKNNYYSNYSIQGQKHPRSYMYTINAGSELYTFIAIDACLKPGPRRPFNFVGILDEHEIKSIYNLINKSKDNNADFIIWFGHYPTSCILSQTNTSIRNIIGRYKESMVYLCGHYHTLGGAVPNMYTLQQAGFLELELADWKDNRMYRLGAIDHGQFSFIDVKHKEWPIVLITNPKHVLYTMPKKENIMSIIKSTHIRILAFSIALIKSVEIQLDAEPWSECEHIKGPLYVLRWNTTNYKEGVHTIRVKVIDIDGRETTVVQPFALDRSRLSFRILPRIILMSNVSNIFQFLFGTVLVLLVIPLCILRFLHILCEIFYALYLTIGPWAIGEVIENQTGVIFAWGTFVGKSFLPGAFTYAYGFFQLFSFHLPLMLILANRVDKRLQNTKPSSKPLSKICFVLQYLPIILLIMMQTCMAYFFWLAYGTLATILCPLRTWSIFLAIVLWYQVDTMPYSCLRSAAKIWSPLGGQIRIKLFRKVDIFSKIRISISLKTDFIVILYFCIN